jgi:flagellin
MSLTRINQNVAAQNAQRNLALNTERISTSMERLSSGLRINRAADDPSGLVMSEALRAQISGLDVVQQNVTEGVNLIKTAEGALSEVNSLLRQVQDLALDSASNSTNTADTRAALQQQLSEALSTIDQIATNTKYAGLSLLNGDLGTTTTIGGAGSAAIDTSSGKTNAITTLPEGTQSGWAGNISLDVTGVAGAGKVTSTKDISGGNVTGTIKLNGVDITFDAASQATVVSTINARSAQTGVTAATSGTGISLTADTLGSEAGVVLVDSGGILNTAAGTVADYGEDATATVTFVGAAEDGSDITVDFDQGSGLALKDADGNQLTLASGSNTVSDKGVVATISGTGAASFQIGLSVSEVASISIQSVETDESGLNLDSIDISTVDGAKAALSVIEDAISTVSNLRGRMGAFQTNTLEAQGRSLAVARENLAASESAIRDTDFGSEMAEYSTAQILVQSATSFLAQANSLPQNVLTLIRGG